MVLTALPSRRPLPSLTSLRRQFSCHCSAAATTASTFVLAAACTSSSRPLIATASTSEKLGFAPVEGNE